MNEKRRVRSQSSARLGLWCAAAAALLLLLTGCAKDPTEVVVTVWSDLSCDDSSVAAVAVGVSGELGDRSFSGTSTTCSPDGSRGDIVVVPKGDSNAEFAIEARISADPSVSIEDCVAANNYKNCIVARRILSFLPERSVHLRMDLRNPCVSTACDQATTCVAQGTTKACLGAKIDVSKCSPECDESTVIAQNPDPVFVPDPSEPTEPSDPCSPNPCDAHGKCMAVAGEAACTCQAGYAHAKAGELACTDIDECAAGGKNDCDPHATCSNSRGGFSCACNEGYAGTDGTSCEQVECNTQCAEQGACVKDSKGQFACRCNDGYEGDGVSCSDIDECAAAKSPCATTAKCANTPGGFTCTCPKGYASDGTVCADVDECADQTAHCGMGKQCVNKPGSFGCEDCAAGYAGDGTTCADVDECSNHTANCDPLATCVNSPGSFDCKCPMGFSNVAGTCTDVNECTTGTPCAANQTCVNTVGGFTCQSPLVNLVPAMTSTTMPSGIISSSGNFDASYPEYQAFDANPASLWLSPYGVVPALLSYDFVSTTPTVTAYEMVFANGNDLLSRGARDWTFEGSNGANDTGWQKLDQRSGITWDVNRTQRFSIAAPGAFRKYRLSVTDDNDPAAGIVVISIGALRLLAPGP